MKKTLAVLVAVCFCLGLAQAVHAQDTQIGKVGYVDLSRAFDTYKKTEAYDKDLEKKREGKQAQRESKVKEIKKLQDKLALLNDKEKDKTQEAIEEKLIALDEFDRAATMDLRKERDDFLKEILKEIQTAIDEYAEKESYTLILNDRVLLYGSSALDITDDIIKVMNSK
ncbi:OmpH family outer membrane protein [Candidatus Omnitrophota bacterium]